MNNKKENENLWEELLKFGGGYTPGVGYSPYTEQIGGKDSQEEILNRIAQELEKKIIEREAPRIKVFRAHAKATFNFKLPNGAVMEGNVEVGEEFAIVDEDEDHYEFRYHFFDEDYCLQERLFKLFKPGSQPDGASVYSDLFEVVERKVNTE